MNAPLQNDRLLRAMRCEPVDRTPIWLMRQAGRYLPEYRELRARAGSFMRMCKTPEIACAITLQPLARFPLDAAILFSDILTIPDAMGLGLEFIEGEGPIFRHPLHTEADIRSLSRPDLATLDYVFQAVTLIRRELAGRVPLIGFSGSPWTLATYMIEGGASKDFACIKALLYDRPDLLHHLLDVLADTVTDYLEAQISAGAQALQIFDTWGGILTTPAYHEFSLAYCARIISALKQSHPQVPIVLFTKGGGLWLEAIAGTGCDVVGLDWTQELGEVRRRIGTHVALQGNLDPMVLMARPEAIIRETTRLLQSYGHGSGHIFNLGHGITPRVPPEHVAILVETVQSASPAYHASRS